MNTNPTPSTLPVQEPAGALSHPGGVEVSALLDSILSEYGWPSNPKNAARAGWTAAMRYIASLPPVTQAKSEAVAWCQLTKAGTIAYFDGKPMVMPGTVGNDCHPDPLYTAPREAVERQPLTETKREELWRSGDWYRPGEIAERNAHDLMEAVEAAQGIGPATQEKQHG